MNRHVTAKRISLALALSSALLGVGGCSDESIDPSAPATGGAAPTSPTATVDDPFRPPAAKRRVIERNPFGHVAISQNLLWDGDFEWTSPFADQYGWYELPSSPTVSDVVIGAACTSGIKCVRLRKNGNLLGIGVGAKDAPLFVSVAIKFEVEGDATRPACSKAELTLIDFGGPGAGDPDASVTATSETADGSGWCVLAGTVPARANKPYLLVSNHGGVPMLVDDAVLTVAETPSPLPGAKQPAIAARAPLPHQLPNIRMAREAIAKLRLPHDAPPSRGELELRAKKGHTEESLHR